MVPKTIQENCVIVYAEVFSFWNVDTWEARRIYSIRFKAPVNSMVFSPDGKILATGINASRVFLWEAETGTLLRILTGLSNRAYSVAFSPDGIFILEQLLATLTPKETALLPNYPNPFNPETWIPYQLAAPAGDFTATRKMMMRK